MPYKVISPVYLSSSFPCRNCNAKLLFFSGGKRSPLRISPRISQFGALFKTSLRGNEGSYPECPFCTVAPKRQGPLELLVCSIFFWPSTYLIGRSATNYNSFSPRGTDRSINAGHTFIIFCDTWLGQIARTAMYLFLDRFRLGNLLHARRKKDIPFQKATVPYFWEEGGRRLKKTARERSKNWKVRNRAAAVAFFIREMDRVFVLQLSSRSAEGLRARFDTKIECRGGDDELRTAKVYKINYLAALLEFVFGGSLSLLFNVVSKFGVSISSCFSKTIVLNKTNISFSFPEWFSAIES